MGIRISKSIGYLVSKKEANMLFSPDYKIKLESLDYDDDQATKFWDNFAIEMKKACNVDVFSQEYLGLKSPPYNFLSEFIYKDKPNGVFFCTLSQHKSHRYDDLIDYYENNNNIKSNIKYLHSSIAPVPKYKLSSRVKLRSIESNTFYYASDLLFAYNQAFMTDLKLEELVKKGSILPKIDPEIYCFAKAADILNPHISQDKFEEYCKAVIVTDWH